MNEEAREYMVEFGTDEEAEGDYRHDMWRQQELDAEQYEQQYDKQHDQGELK